MTKPQVLKDVLVSTTGKTALGIVVTMQLVKLTNSILSAFYGLASLICFHSRCFDFNIDSIKYSLKRRFVCKVVIELSDTVAVCREKCFSSFQEQINCVLQSSPLTPINLGFI